jgi:4-amino-4-deoxy-L-arabinose transferase-like glycosyltransferase
MSRTPETALQAAGLLFGSGAVAFGFLFFFWRRVNNFVVFTVRWIDRLSMYRFWILVFGIALLFRLLVAFGLPYQPTEDGLWYHEAATALSMGKGLTVGGELTAFHPPGYPYFLSLTYRLFGPYHGLAWFWGILSTAIIMLSTHFIARQLYGLSIAKIATLAIATYPALALWTGTVMSDLPFLAGLLLLISFIVYTRPYRLLNTVIIGITLGLLTLTRGVALGLFVIIPMIWYIQCANARKLVTFSLLLFITYAAFLTPWIQRNYSLFGKLTLSTNLGQTVYIGNHHGATGGFVPTSFSRYTSTLNEAEGSRELLGEAVKFIVSHPAEAALLIPKKMMHLFLLETSAVTWLFQGERVYPPWLKYSLYGITQLCYIPFLLLFFLRIVELLHVVNRPRGLQWTGWLFAFYFTLLCLIFLGEDRYRLPILPWMMLESSVLLSRLTGLHGENGGAEFSPSQPSKVR